MGTCSDECPFLVPVTADFLWTYRVPGYCRRPDAQVRVPAPATLMCLCTTCQYVRCPGFLAARQWEGRSQGRCLTGGAPSTW